MQQQAPHQRHPAYYWIVLGCVLSVVFWIADSGIEAWLLGEHSFSAQLFRPEPIEIYHRLYIGGLWLAFSLCAFTVVRQRTRADQALRESEARFRDLIESSLQGILIHRDDKALFVNQAYADIFGYETPDAISRLETLESLIAPSELDRLRRYHNDRLAGKEVPTHYEYQGVRQDGSLVWLDMQVRVVLWQGVPAVQSTVFDITERNKQKRPCDRVKNGFAIWWRAPSRGSCSIATASLSLRIRHTPRCMAMTPRKTSLGWRTSSKTSLHPRIVRD